MKERPMIFNTEMVRAILCGRKTSTRRPVTPQPNEVCSGVYEWRGCAWPAKKESGYGDNDEYDYDSDRNYVHMTCPYGEIGDRLWVRESCKAEELDSGIDGVRYLADDSFVMIENTIEASDKWIDLNYYRGGKSKIVPSIHMPRWASRILLEITNVRVERVFEITDQDAISEGMLNYNGWKTKEYIDQCNQALENGTNPPLGLSPRERFQQLWRSIYGGESWDNGSFVWVIELKIVEVKK